MNRLLSLTIACLFLSTMGPARAELPTEDPPVGKLHPLLADTIKQGPYEAQWKSLVTHPMPEWFAQDKIGISAHWGPYAVPGWTPRKDTPYGVAYAEWYWQWLKQNKAVQAYHKQHYGDAKYDDFINGTQNLVTGQVDGFFAKQFDADQWMRLFKEAGARYFFITSKHHDGFCLWDSAYTNRNAKQMGPKRDLYGEMVQAARKHGLRIGLYYSFYEWNNPIYREKPSLDNYKGVKKLKDEDGDGNANEYVDDFMVPQIKELIDKYHPDYLCFDGEWEHGYTYWRARQIVAYYYNQAAARDQEVIINDRFGQKKEGVSDTRGVYGDFYHVEYFANIDRAKPWSMWRGFGNSYGYNRNEHPSNILSIKQVIQMLVDVVADNGNVEFNLGPKADGTIAEFEQERLLAMGKWLKINGDAIYETEKSPVGILPQGRVTHKSKSKTLYYHVYDWPKDGVIELPGIFNDIRRASLLANNKSLEVSRTSKDTVQIHLPQTAPDPHVSVIKLRYKGKLKAEKYVPKVKADKKGNYHLGAPSAVIHGKTLRFEEATGALGFWSDRNDYPEWKVVIDKSDYYDVTVEYACVASEAGGSYYFVHNGERIDSQAFVVENTGAWNKFTKIKFEEVFIERGTHTVSLRSAKPSGPLMNLKSITVRPSHPDETRTQAKTSSAPYVHDVPIDPDDSPEEILSKAANVVPSPAQMLYHKDEFTGFIHFGPNTFTGVEWGNGKEDPNVFNPGDTLDTDQWCHVMQAAGMKKVIITVKHHDGFCTWQTRYNASFSVRAIPWRDGQGDVLRELADSCKKYGLKLGVYLSPADLYQIENENGLYGNLSKYQETVIPTDPATFKTKPTKVRPDKPKDAPTFTVQADDYNRYFMNQLYELLTEYGPIHEVWFDGAHPKRKGGQKYIKSEWFDMIRVLAPDATIFGGPDIRWCGNEGGYTRESEWNVLPIQEYQSSGEDRPIPGPGTEESLIAGKYTVYGKPYTTKYLYYMIAEVDTSIRAGWFWRNEHEQSVRTPDDVFDIYERSVGGNTGFLLNIPPDNQGRFGPRDEACLLEVGKRIRETYGINLAAEARIGPDDSSADIADGNIRKIWQQQKQGSYRGSHAVVLGNWGGLAHALCDGKLSTFWEGPQGRGGCFVVTLPKVQTINRFVLQEAIDTKGQRIKKHALDARINREWQTVAIATTVGYKRILRFPAVTTKRFRVRILDSRLSPTVAEIAAHYYMQPPPPVVARRNRNDKVVLETVAPSNQFAWKQHGKRGAIPNEHTQAPIHFTLDGKEPTAQSPVYHQALELPEGGRIRARTIVKGELGPVADQRLGIAPQGLKIHQVNSQHSKQFSAEKAIDGDPQTFWHTSWASGYPTHPHRLSIDLGRELQIEGLTYLPRQDKRVADGMIESGTVETSLNGWSWTAAGQFNFGNLLNDPQKRVFMFDRTMKAKYVRISSHRGVQGKPFAGAAEIEILAVTGD